MLIATATERRRVDWDPADREATAKVREEFDRIIDHSFAYKTTEKGSEQIRRFDPEAESITMTAPLVGG